MTYSNMMVSLVFSSGNWWEPGTPNYFDVGDLSAILGFFIAFIGASYAATKWWMKALRSVIKEEIEVATKPIHPNSNGGLSLPDVARKADQLEKQMIDLAETTNETRDLLVKVLSQSIILPSTEQESKQKTL